MQITDPEGNDYTKAKTGGFPASTLSPGDVVEIGVIATDTADSPEWQGLDPRFPGGVAIRSSPDPVNRP